MRKLVYKITEEKSQSQSIYHIEFITDRTPEWTESQYLRNRDTSTTMELVSDEETKEKEPTSRKVELG
tara:strand:- start:787 stop:990 length:204 start_codon:yes stop_codon:yes gene_type:complete